jgi:hypothetical protein
MQFLTKLVCLRDGGRAGDEIPGLELFRQVRANLMNRLYLNHASILTVKAREGESESIVAVFFAWDESAGNMV